MAAGDGLDALRDERGPAASEQAAPEPELFYGSVDEFVREKLTKTYRRVVGRTGAYRWSTKWWESAEALSRLEALWRSWEALRLDPALGMSVWWRDHADYHMAVLMSADGPFAKSEDSNERGDALPYEKPPEGLFPDVRTGEI